MFRGRLCETARSQARQREREKDIQAMWSSYIIAADILLRSWILIEENLKTRTGVLIAPQEVADFWLDELLYI